jgi:hypothetical protein
MISKTNALRILLLSSLVMMGVASIFANSPRGTSSPSVTTPQAAVDVRGTWSGTFFSKHSNVPPFTMTVVISPNSSGRLVGNSSLNSECLKGVQMQITVSGSNVVLAGSDEEGDSLTVRGTVDSTGALLKASYIINGSASGRCETDDGAGSLAKR